jgi:cell division septation protein DedD
MDIFPTSHPRATCELGRACDGMDDCTARRRRLLLIRPRTLTRSYTADIRTQSWVPSHPAPDCPQLHLDRARTAPLWARLCIRAGLNLRLYWPKSALGRCQHWRAHPLGDLPTSAPGLRPHRGTVDGQYVFTGMYGAALADANGNEEQAVSACRPTPSPTETPTPTPSPTNTPTPAPIPVPTAQPTASPTHSPVETPTPAPTFTPSTAMPSTATPRYGVAYGC